MPDALAVFAIVFAVIGGTELVDRTNFALISVAAKQPAFPSWVGAASAFALASGLGVAVGSALLDALHGEVVYLRLGGGLLLLGYAGYLLLVPEHHRAPPAGRSAVVTSFLLILLLEMGDTTQILLIVFVATFSNPLVVFAAGTLALVLVAGAACVIGSRLGARVEPRLLERVVVVVLLVVGVITIVYALEPGLFPPALGG